MNRTRGEILTEKQRLQSSTSVSNNVGVTTRCEQTREGIVADPSHNSTEALSDNIFKNPSGKRSNSDTKMHILLSLAEGVHEIIFDSQHQEVSNCYQSVL